MKYVLMARVLGNAYIKEPFQVSVDDVSFSFSMGADGRLDDVTATMTVAPDTFKMSSGPGTTTDWHLTVTGGEEVHARLLGAIQRLHAHLGFSAQGAIESVDWREVAVEFVPESDDERANLKLYRAAFHREWPKQRAGLGEELLAACARATATHDHTFIPKSFWLEAQRCFSEQRYIQAYYNFYFVIEACFAEGKFHEDAVVERFVASSELSTAISTAIQRLGNFPEHQKQIQTWCSEENVALDVAGVSRLLFRLRGRLHHFSGSSSRPQPTPFNDDDYQPIAWFTMSIATQVILILDMKVSHMYVARTTNVPRPA